MGLKLFKEEPKRRVPKTIDFSRYNDFCEWKILPPSANYLSLLDNLPPIIDNNQRNNDHVQINSNSIIDQNNVMENRTEMQTDNNNYLILEKLPDEMKLQIIYFLPIKDILVMERVSKMFKAWASLDVFWREKLNYLDNTVTVKAVKGNPRSARDYVLLYERFVQEICQCQFNTVKDIDYLYNAVLFGSMNSGKSEYLRSFNQIKFNSEYTPTIGVEFSVKYMHDNNASMKFLIWDCSGDSKFTNVTSSYLRGALVVFFCFDLSDSNSFEEMKKEITQKDTSHTIRRDMNAESFSYARVLYIILGMKRDLPRQVSKESIHDYLSELVPSYSNGTSREFFKTKLVYFEVSSKEDSNQSLLFPLQYAFTFRMCNNTRED